MVTTWMKSITNLNPASPTRANFDLLHRFRYNHCGACAMQRRVVIPFSLGEAGCLWSSGEVKIRNNRAVFGAFGIPGPASLDLPLFADQDMVEPNIRVSEAQR